MTGFFHRLKSLLKPARQRRGPTEREQRVGSYRPCLEALEERLALSSISVSNVTSHEGGWFYFHATVIDCAGSHIYFETADGTARAADNDYQPLLDGFTASYDWEERDIAVKTNWDTKAEIDETFYLKVYQYPYGQAAWGTGTILNDDGPPPVGPGIFINDVTLWEGDGYYDDEGNFVQRNFAFTVGLSQGSAQTVTVDFATGDYGATAGYDYAATSGTLIFPPGATAATITVPFYDDYDYETDEMFVIGLSNPTNAYIDDWGGVGTILDDDPNPNCYYDEAGDEHCDPSPPPPPPPPPPSPPALSISDVSVTEGNTGATAAVFTVSLSAASDQTVTVHYSTLDGSATLADNDYQSVADTVTFAPGETSKTIVVQVKGDRIAEPNQDFYVRLDNPGGAVLGDSLGVGSILDDEPRIAISDVSLKEGRSGTRAFVFTVSLSMAYDVPLTLNFATRDGTASTVDNDYRTTSGTLTFAPGETSKTITVWVNGDRKKEADETFFVDLWGADFGLIADGVGIGTIRNDD